jgi:predicted DNA-binding transcriptional regulator AlpA
MVAITSPRVLPRKHAKFPEFTMLTREDVASIFDISLRTLDRWVSGGDIPEPLKVGGRTYWTYSQIKDWIEQGCPAQNNGNLPRSRRPTNGVNL